MTVAPVTSLSVSRAACEGSGSPVLFPTSSHGRCARCGDSGPLTATTRVVSRNFTGLDSWVCPRGQGLCPACGWLLGARALREQAHLVRASGRLVECSLTKARAVLARPLGVDQAMVVPLHRARKHVMPAAQWAHVTTEDGPLAWTASDAHRLHVTATLRERGVPGPRLGDPAPPWPVVAGASARERSLLLGWWAELDPWRRARPWLRLAVTVTSSGRELEEEA